MVEGAYTQLLKRNSDAGGRAAHLKALRRGDVTVRQLVLNFVNSPEFKNRFVPKKGRKGRARRRRALRVARMLVFRLLNRPARRAERNAFAAMYQRKGFAKTVNAIMSLPEYNKRFGENCLAGSPRKCIASCALLSAARARIPLFSDVQLRSNEQTVRAGPSS